MDYMDRGLGMPFLAGVFCVLCVLASFGIGNATQVGAVAQAMARDFSIPPLATGVVMALAAGLGLYLLNMASPVNLLAGLYFSQLLSNTIPAWTRRGRQRRIFAAGLTLFAGCDLCVGLFNVLPPSAPLYPVSSVGMWFFYLPSQVLIALSALPEKEETP